MTHQISRLMMKLFSMILILLTITATIDAQTKLKGRAIKIIDGDTFDLLVDKTTYQIRLADIDCPEKGQDFYKVSKQALSDYLYGSYIEVIYNKKDRNGRILGSVYNGPVYINLIMVEEGYAWHFKKYSSDQRFAKAEINARKAQRGLWKQPKPIAPWDFRQIRRKN
ncbi:MAG TPA: thermonuclease family protein [Chitinophagaceae bacterium]|nr:thermonuclease family protein [Chitinophagaceae bacterium]